MAFASSGFGFQGTPVAVGDQAPDFELSDANGRVYKLSDFRGRSAVVLEFFRSGDW
jgi:peroxiredoxin Q/BCP